MMTKEQEAYFKEIQELYEKLKRHLPENAPPES